MGITDASLVNPTPNDNQNAQLQPTFGQTGVVSWYQETFSGWGSGTTQYTDTAGHASNWIVDGSWRVTKSQDFNGSLWLQTEQTWDTNNNIITSTDPRGKMTTYAYDQYGDTLAVLQPLITTTTAGTVNPLALYTTRRIPIRSA